MTQFVVFLEDCGWGLLGFMATTKKNGDSFFHDGKKFQNTSNIHFSVLHPLFNLFQTVISLLINTKYIAFVLCTANVHIKESSALLLIKRTAVLKDFYGNLLSVCSLENNTGRILIQIKSNKISC